MCLCICICTCTCICIWICICICKVYVSLYEPPVCNASSHTAIRLAGVRQMRSSQATVDGHNKKHKKQSRTFSRIVTPVRNKQNKQNANNNKDVYGVNCDITCYTASGISEQQWHEHTCKHKKQSRRCLRIGTPDGPKHIRTKMQTPTTTTTKMQDNWRRLGRS